MDFAFPGYSHHTYRSPDGRFAFSGTTVSGSFPPRQGSGGAYSNPMIPMLQTLQTILGDISDQHDDYQRQNQTHHNFHHHHHTVHGNRSPRPDEPSRRYSPDPDPTGIDQYAEFESLFPRDTDRPQRMAPPVENLAEYVYPAIAFHDKKELST